MKMVKINDELELPLLGFGCWELAPGGEAQRAVEIALEVGYRHIDTADAYGNHSDVAKALRNSKIEREKFFITTKVWRDSLEKEDLIESANRFLEELEIPYIDLLLIHWPNREVPIEDSLGAMNGLKEKGIIKAFGVSNFTIHHLEDALKTGFQFSNNQVELHPTFQNRELVRFCKENGITVTSYSSNGRGGDLELPEIQELAEKYERTPYQIILAWLRQQEILAIPRSRTEKHIRENFESQDFDLSLEDIAKIDAISQEPRLGNPGFSDFDY